MEPDRRHLGGLAQPAEPVRVDIGPERQSQGIDHNEAGVGPGGARREPLLRLLCAHLGQEGNGAGVDLLDRHRAPSSGTLGLVDGVSPDGHHWPLTDCQKALTCRTSYSLSGARACTDPCTEARYGALLSARHMCVVPRGWAWWSPSARSVTRVVGAQPRIRHVRPTATGGD